MDCFRPVLFVAVPLMVIGCSSGEELPETIPVTGRITYAGAPVPSGTIALYPVERRTGNEDRPATGEIVDGTFQLTTFEEFDGVMPGRYKVVVVSADGGGVNFETMVRVPQKWLVPQKFAAIETTPLEVEISPESTELVLDLQDDSESGGTEKGPEA